MKKVFQLLFGAALLLLPSLSSLRAQTNLSVQGTIQNFNGSAVDNGLYDVIFKLYTTDAGGTAVWSETQSAQVTGGVYSVLLGSVNPLTVAFDQTYYLGITLPGGPELTPRSRLTSSPYALSVIGQTNIFPSTGAIGVGTTTPTAGNELHVKDAAAAAQVLVEGATTSKVVVQSTDGSEIEFKKGANTASITYDGTKINVQNLNLSGFSPAELAVTSKLAVGQGSVDPNNALRVVGNTYFDGFVEINGSKTLSVGGTTFFNSSYGNGAGLGAYGGDTRPFKCKVNGDMLTTGSFMATSDRRIKKDFHLSENQADLTMLRKLRVTDYRHIDEIGKGSEFKKGFIAQEVKEAYPEAVTLYTDFIPNVYALSTRNQVSGGKITISVEKNHEFVVGDEVKLVLPDGDQKLTVTAVPSATSFTVDWNSEAAPEKVFVYGKKISDFHSVDYNRVFVLNVSATQELARRVEQLEAENASLRQRNDGLQQKTDHLQQQNEGLRSDLNGLGERLLRLEKQAGGNLEK